MPVPRIRQRGAITLTALATVQAGDADGISYVLTEDDPFAAIDLDHCRDVTTCSIDVWAQNFLDTGRLSYSEVTPSGTGCRIWGLANGATVHKKFSLEIRGKQIAAELFRRTNKVLTITGYKLDTVRELTNIDRLIDWGVVWGERRKAAAAEAAVTGLARTNGNGLNGNGSKYSIDEIELIVRNGAPAGANRSDVFHGIVGHYVGCGWSVEQIAEHLQQFPDGIGSRYLSEHRLHNEIVRSAGKYAQRALPLFNGNGGWVNSWEAKTPHPKVPEQPPAAPEPEPQLPKPDDDDPELNDDAEDDDEDTVDIADDDDVDAPASDPTLPLVACTRRRRLAATKELVGQAPDSSRRVRVALRTMGCRQDVCRL